MPLGMTVHQRLASMQVIDGTPRATSNKLEAVPCADCDWWKKTTEGNSMEVR
jgi:hypothetical protein